MNKAIEVWIQQVITEDLTVDKSEAAAYLAETFVHVSRHYFHGAFRTKVYQWYRERPEIHIPAIVQEQLITREMNYD